MKRLTKKYKAKFLGTKGYEGLKSGWYGDCIIIYNDDIMVVYDCGSAQHADTVIQFMENNGFKKN